MIKDFWKNYGLQARLLGKLGDLAISLDVEIFRGLYKERKVLVTGHTGFKGAWLAFWLQSLGARVIGYSLEPPSKPSLFKAVGLEKKITHVHGDIRNAQSLNSVFNKYQPEIVFHSAAQSLVRYSYLNPIETYETNVMGTANIFEAVRRTNSAKVVINVTSDKCYDNKEVNYAYKEEDPMGGYDPYSSSKGCAELITSAYRNSFFSDGRVRISSVRAGNVVGGGDWAQDRIVPDCIRALSICAPITIRNPKSIRPWQYVLEPLSGYLWLASLLWSNTEDLEGGWNFGPDDSNNITVEQVVEDAINFWGAGSWKLEDNPNPLHEAKLLKLNNSKAKRLLNWFPIYDKDKTFGKTVNWYRSYYKNGNAEELCLKDISDYVNTAREKRVNWSLADEKVGITDG